MTDQNQALPIEPWPDHSYRPMLDNLTAGLLIIDQAATIRFANQAACRILGRPAANIVGLDIQELLAPLSRLLAPLQDGVENCVLMPGNSKQYIGFGMTKFSQPGSTEIFHTCLFQDISMMRKLRAERDQLLQLATVSQMIPTLLHEFRNPIAAISAMTEILLEESSDLKLKQDLRSILNEIHRINVILQGVGETGWRLRCKRFMDITQVLENTVFVLQPIAERAGVFLHREIEPLPLLQFDTAVIRSIVLNLAMNAITACARGDSVYVGAHLTDKNIFELWIRDTGSGMTSEVLSRCTELFYTTNPTANGMGLSLCSQAAEAAGGKLEIQSQIGKGTSVTLKVSAS